MRLLFILTVITAGIALAQTSYIGGGRTVEGAINYCGADSGTGNAYVCAMPSTATIKGYQDGAKYSFKATHTNTGSSTLNIDGKGVIPIKTRGNADISAGTITSGDYVTVTYDPSNTAFQLGTGGTGVSGLSRVLLPSAIATGTGTEASPYTHADGTAGVQTQVNALSDRGGLVQLNAGRYDFIGTSSVALFTPGMTISGVSAGFAQDPNAEKEGVSGTKLRRTSNSPFFVVGNPNASDRPGGIKISDLALWGPSKIIPQVAPFDANVCVYFKWHTDWANLTNLRIGNCGIAINFQNETGVTTATDSAEINRVYLVGNNTGIVLWPSQYHWFMNLRDSLFADNDAEGIVARNDNVAFTKTASDIRLQGNILARNCRLNSACISKAGWYWAKDGATITGNVSFEVGHTINAGPADQAIITANIADASAVNVPTYNNGEWIAADAVLVKGDANTITANSFENQPVTNTAAIRIQGNRNRVTANSFQNCLNPVIIDAGASDNIIDQPGITIVDNGTRTVFNGHSNNAGDPNTTGVWNGVNKWAGLIIRDTTGNITYYYTSPSTRLQLGGGFTGTAGSIPFVGAGGSLTENNAKLSWNNTNSYLGIGTGTPRVGLDITLPVGANMVLTNTNTTSSAVASYYLETNSTHWGISTWNALNGGALPGALVIQDNTTAGNPVRMAFRSSGEINIGGPINVGDGSLSGALMVLNAAGTGVTFNTSGLATGTGLDITNTSTGGSYSGNVAIHWQTPTRNYYGGLGGTASGGVEDSMYLFDATGSSFIYLLKDAQWKIIANLQLQPGAARPACNVANRGTHYFTNAAAGTADIEEVCRKDSANAYGWQAVW